MNVRRKLLWIDCTAGGIVGLAMLLLDDWLSKFYGLPRNLLVFMGVVNLAYASYSFSLAVRSRRPMGLIRLLVGANLTWSVICLVLAVVLAGTAHWLGLAHLVGEALFVGCLAWLEWRWRELLLTA